MHTIVWISCVERIVNPHLPITETDSYGTIGMQKNIDAKWNFALNAVFPNESDRDDAIAPDLGLGQEVLNQLIQHDYKEWNTAANKQSDAIPEKGVRALTLLLCTVHDVLGIEYCPPLPDLGESSIFMCKRACCTYVQSTNISQNKSSIQYIMQLQYY